jgi:DNA-binding transcriptional ArsR family regulator
MLRIRLTTQDLFRIRLTPAVTPLAETMHSLVALQPGCGNEVLHPWKHRVLRVAAPHLRAVAPLASGGTHLNLADIAGPHRDISDGISAVLEADPETMQYELDRYAERVGNLPAPLRHLAADRQLRAQLMAHLDRYHRAAVRPWWPHIRELLHAEHAHRARVAIDGGIDVLLTTLHPALRWVGTTFELPSPADHTIVLDGRGITLAPSVFHRRPAAHTDQKGRVTLIYPVHLDQDPNTAVWSAPPQRGELGALLGRRRADLLTAICNGASSTGQLALRLGTSAAAVSQHTKVLRDAGLISTTRAGRLVRHTITIRGKHLLGPSRAVPTGTYPAENGEQSHLALVGGRVQNAHSYRVEWFAENSAQVTRTRPQHADAERMSSQALGE